MSGLTQETLDSLVSGPVAVEAASDASAEMGPLTAKDLADLMAGFTEASAKLEATHATLRAEVRRLDAELRRANEELERSRRLAALGEMAAGIAHEVRNPLGSIALYARLVEDDIRSGGPGGDESAAMVQKIRDAVRGLNAVVGDVLTFSREVRPEGRRLRAAEIVWPAADACVDLLPERYGVSGVETPVHADEHLARRAVANVLRNACEAAREGAANGGTEPRVEIRVAVARRSGGGRTRQGVVVGVHDNGPGIPAEVVDRMFNPFFTTRAAGTGLGLAIVHRIMDAHGGSVRVGNSEQEGLGGAVVELFFPNPPAGGEDGSGAHG